MTNELKPCPFCGSEVAVRYEPNCDLYYVHCYACGAETGDSGLYRKEDKAIEAWNTRAERTCIAEENIDASYGDCMFVCSECGADLDNEEFPNYCPNCGAKVTEEDSDD